MAEKKQGNPTRKLPRGITMQRGRYRVRVYWEGKQVSCGIYETLTQAKAAKRVYEGQVVTGTFEPPTQRRKREREERAAEKERTRTVEQLADAWLESFQEQVDTGKRKASSLVSYKSALKHALAVIGPKPVLDVTDADIRGILNGLKQRGKHSECANLAQYMRTMWRFGAANNFGGLERVPESLTGDQWKPKDSGRVDEDFVASPREVDQFAQALPDELQLAPYLAGWCALRRGEVFGLQRHDFRGLTGDIPTMRVERQWNSKAAAITGTKNNETRTVVIPPSLVPLIVDHLAKFVGPEPDAFLFPSPLNAKRPLSPTAFDRRWSAANKQVRPGFKFHNLRHTALTQFAQTGATDADIGRRGGHKDLSVARRYQHSVLQRQSELVAKLPVEVFGSIGEENAETKKTAELVGELNALLANSRDPNLRALIVEALAAGKDESE